MTDNMKIGALVEDQARRHRLALACQGPIRKLWEWVDRGGECGFDSTCVVENSERVPRPEQVIKHKTWAIFGTRALYEPLIDPQTVPRQRVQRGGQNVQAIPQELLNS